MLLQPKNRIRFRKDRKGFIPKKAVETRANKLEFGCYGLKCTEARMHYIKASQIESVRRVLVRKMKRSGRVWIRIFPQKSVTGKPTKTRMGKGKGSIQFWVCPIKPGQVIFEISGDISYEIAKQILNQASQKLPVLTRFITHNSTSFISS